MKIGWPAVLAVFVLPTIACAQPNTAEEIDQSVEEQRARAAIDDGNSRYIEAFGAADAAGVANVYDADGARLYADGSIIRGREAIQADVQQFVERVGPVTVTLETRLVWVLKGEAYEPGRWTYTYQPPGKDERTISGTYINVWKLQPDGNWMLFADLSLPNDFR